MLSEKTVIIPAAVPLSLRYEINLSYIFDILYINSDFYMKEGTRLKYRL